MKLHEFTDRLYAMGGIEQERKKRRILTEGIGDRYKIVYEPYERYTSSGVKEAQFSAPTLYDALCKLCEKLSMYLDLEQIEEDEMTAEDIVDYLSSVNGDGCDYIFKFENLSNGAVIIDGGDPEDFMDNWDDFEESLTEARNPENDEVNAAIRRYLSSDKAYIPKKDRDLFDKYGISPGKFKRQLGRYMDGPNGGVISADSVDMVHPDYDLAGDLTKKKLDKGDKEHPTKDWMKWIDIYGDSPASDNDESRMSSNQFDSLQPYWQEKTAIRDAGRRRKRALRDEEERIQSIRDDTQRTLKYIDDDKARFIKSAKKKAAKRKKAEKNESLNESAYDMRDGDLRDEFYSLIDGMDPAEVVDMMYWYLDDYALEDMIKDIKGHTNETEE